MQEMIDRLTEETVQSMPPRKKEPTPAKEPGTERLSAALYTSFGPFAIRVNPHLKENGLRHHLYEVGFDPEDAEPFIKEFIEKCNYLKKQFPSKPIQKYLHPRKRNACYSRLIRHIVQKYQKATAQELWKAIPEEEEIRIGEFKFYRETEKLLRVIEFVGESWRDVGKPLKFDAFRKRVYAERNKPSR